MGVSTCEYRNAQVVARDVEGRVSKVDCIWVEVISYCMS